MIRNIEEHKSSLRKFAKAAKTRDNPLIYTRFENWGPAISNYFIVQVTVNTDSV